MRLIDKDWVELRQFTAAGSMSEYGRGWNEALAYVVENAPTIEAEPVRHGRWIFKGKSNGRSIYQCSECKNDISGSAAYCKECGAKMDQEAET